MVKEGNYLRSGRSDTGEREMRRLRGTQDHTPEIGGFRRLLTPPFGRVDIAGWTAVPCTSPPMRPPGLTPSVHTAFKPAMRNETSHGTKKIKRI